MKKYFNNKIPQIHRIALTALISIFIYTASYAQTANFSGAWLINKQKINFNNAPEWILPIKLVVNQSQDEIKIKTIILNENSEENSSDIKLGFSGLVSETTTSSGYKLLASVRWSNDKQSLVISSQNYAAGSQSYDKLAQTWSLMDDGNTLVIERSVEQSDGFKYSIKAFYDKQK